jgi:diguanylate cyclase (GGDEF)-like protein
LASLYNTPEERQKVVQAIIDGCGKATQVEAALKHKNGSVIWISTSAYICKDPDGTPVCIEGVARDISERKRMEDQLRTLSRIDALTGAYTRRHFMDKSEAAIQMVKRYKRSASIMIADLDNFKMINDKFGHQAGDLALVSFAAVCQKEIRESDIFGRLGGEEFGLMLPETPISQAAILAERIREATAAVDILMGNTVIKMTVSIGLAEIDTNYCALESAMHRADLAMYQAKEMGRNRVVIAT